MAAILGIGATHNPLLLPRDEDRRWPLRRVMESAVVPEALRNPANWPEPMRREWGRDEGVAHAREQRAQQVVWFRKLRAILDEFRPDFVVMWGDDQYGNFKEDVIPAFCVYAYESFEAKPLEWAPSNAWGEPADKAFHWKGHRTGAKYLASALLEDGFDVAYAYQPLHQPLGHAFENTYVYLDYDRKGMDHPLVPFAVNCYGRRVIAQRGGFQGAGQELELDPPSPAPWRCFDLGAATARALARSPWRVALIASSSWSHGFLTAKNHYLWPDLAADHELFDALVAGEYEKWRQYPLAAIEESGQAEVLNWMCLAGAMAELGRKPNEAEFIDTWILNSPKCFAYFLP